MEQSPFLSTSVKGALGLIAWLWLAPAHALPIYTPITLNDPTPQEDASFGRSVAGVGDVNGDSVSDLLMGAGGLGGH